LIHFELIFVQGGTRTNFCSSTRGCPVLPESFDEEAGFSPMCVFATFVDNQRAVATWVYFWILPSIPLVYVSVFVSVLCCFSYYAFVV
jgi:hypothetical protein